LPFAEIGGKKVLFVHIPKTAGTSVEAWLGEVSGAPLRMFSVGIPAAMKCTPQHLRMVDLRHFFGEGFFDYAFTLVRNPFDRIASEYRMRAQLAGDSFFKHTPTFSYWIDHNLTRAAAAPFHLDNHIRPQWQFIGSQVRVFRMEDGVNAALGQVAADLGIAPPETVPHKLATADGPETPWDRGDILRVSEFYARDFKEFGYDPEWPPGLPADQAGA
jgi:hypothetical protein